MRILPFIFLSGIIHAGAFFAFDSEDLQTGPEIAVRRGRSAVNVSFVSNKPAEEKTYSPDIPDQPVPKDTNRKKTAIEQENKQTKKTEGRPASGDSGVQSKGALIGQGRPEYPRISLMRGEQGRVGVLITIDETGRCTDIDIKESPGYSRLERSVVTFLNSAEFKPARDSQGRPVASQINITYLFTLTGKGVSRE